MLAAGKCIMITIKSRLKGSIVGEFSISVENTDSEVVHTGTTSGQSISFVISAFETTGSTKDDYNNHTVKVDGGNDTVFTADQIQTIQVVV